jgi:hypothetical protein
LSVTQWSGVFGNDAANPETIQDLPAFVSIALVSAADDVRKMYFRAARHGAFRQAFGFVPARSIEQRERHVLRRAFRGATASRSLRIRILTGPDFER